MDFLTPLWLLALGVYALCLGSMATALVYRLPRMIPVGGRARSACPSCGHALRARDLIPLWSWAAQRGRCRYCGVSIGIVYPLVELATLAACVAMVFAFGIGFSTAALFLLAPVWVAIVAIDLEHKIIPDVLNAAIAWLMPVGLLVYGLETGMSFDAYIAAAIAALMGAALYGGGAWALMKAAEKILKREAMGWGDIKFFAASGLWLGYSVETLALFMILSGVSGIVLGLLWRRFRGEREFPFGPSLVLSFALTLLAKSPIFFHI